MVLRVILSIFCGLNGQYGLDNSTWMNKICDFYSCQKSDLKNEKGELNDGKIKANL